MRPVPVTGTPGSSGAGGGVLVTGGRLKVVRFTQFAGGRELQLLDHSSARSPSVRVGAREGLTARPTPRQLMNAKVTDSLP